MSSFESGSPQEHTTPSDIPDYYGHQLSAASPSPKADFIGAGNGEITCPYVPDETDAGQHTASPSPKERVASDKHAVRPGYVIAAVGVVTAAAITGLSVSRNSPESHAAPSASASANPEASPSTEPASNKPHHSATATPNPAKTSDNNGTSGAEKATQFLTKTVNRLTKEAQALQGKSSLLGISHDSDDGCLDHTPYAHGVIKVEGVLQPGPTVVNIHPEDPTHHTGTPDLVFKSSIYTIFPDISPADDYTEAYAKDHDCPVKYGEVDLPNVG